MSDCKPTFNFASHRVEENQHYHKRVRIKRATNKVSTVPSSVEYTPAGKLQDSEWGVRKYETLREGGEGGQSWRPSLVTNHDFAGIVRTIKMDSLK